MNSAPASDKELFHHLALLTNEINQTQQPFQRLDSVEGQIRGALEELLSENSRLREQVKRMESIARDMASSALDDAEQESQTRQELEKENKLLERKIQALEEGLESKEAKLGEVEQQFSERIRELTEQLQQKETFVQLRGNILNELNTTIESMNRIATGLAELPQSGPIQLDERQVTPAQPNRDEIKQIEDRMSSEIDKLKRELRDRDLTIAGQSAEIEMIKESTSLKIQELQRGADSKSKKRSAVGFLTDIGAKRFL